MGVNRALRRAAAKKAFKNDIRMSDLDKEICSLAKDDAVRKMSVDLTMTMVRAACLVVICDFKKISKKDTRIGNMVQLMHGYIKKIRARELSREELEAIIDVEEAMKLSLKEDEDNGK